MRTVSPFVASAAATEPHSTLSRWETRAMSRLHREVARVFCPAPTASQEKARNASSGSTSSLHCRGQHDISSPRLAYSEGAAAQFFKSNGYVSNVPLLSPDQVRAIRKYVFDDAQMNFGFGPKQHPLQHVNICLDHPFLWNEICGNPTLINLCLRIFGTEQVKHLSTTMFCKYPRDSPLASPNAVDTTDDLMIAKKKSEQPTVGWHQDHYYWNLRPTKVLTCWLAIDDSTEENGCLQVVPFPTIEDQQPLPELGPDGKNVFEFYGKHNELVFHDTDCSGDNVLMGNQNVQPYRFGGADRAIPLPLRAGEASLHCGYMLHGSGANNSNLRRAGIAIQIMPPEVELGPFAYDGIVGRNENTVSQEDWRKPIMLEKVQSAMAGK